jgi:hypothetical protein
MFLYVKYYLEKSQETDKNLPFISYLSIFLLSSLLLLHILLHIYFFLVFI